MLYISFAAANCRFDPFWIIAYRYDFINGKIAEYSFLFSQKLLFSAVSLGLLFQSNLIPGSWLSIKHKAGKTVIANQ